MPLFEYICQECQQRFETITRGAVLPTCPSCHATTVEKQFSAFAVGGPSDSASSVGPGRVRQMGRPVLNELTRPRRTQTI